MEVGISSESMMMVVVVVIDDWWLMMMMMVQVYDAGCRCRCCCWGRGSVFWWRNLAKSPAAAPCHPTNPLWVSLIKIYMSWGFPLTYERGLIGGFNMVQLWKTPRKAPLVPPDLRPSNSLVPRDGNGSWVRDGENGSSLCLRVIKEHVKRFLYEVTLKNSSYYCFLKWFMSITTISTIMIMIVKGQSKNSSRLWCEGHPFIFTRFIWLDIPGLVNVYSLQTGSHCHRNSWFTHKKWMDFPQFFVCLPEGSGILWRYFCDILCKLIILMSNISGIISDLFNDICLPEGTTMIRSESRRSRTSWLQVSCGPWWWWSSNEKRRFSKRHQNELVGWNFRQKFMVLILIYHRWFWWLSITFMIIIFRFSWTFESW